MRKMHADETHIDLVLVHQLVAAQFPAWAALPLVPVRSAGTVNALFRLGSELVVRLPRTPFADGELAAELRWLPFLAPHLPLQVPQPLAQGRPAHGYPWSWAVFRWLPGDDLVSAPLTDLVQATRDLAAFIAALRQVDTTGAPAARTSRLAQRAAPTDGALAQLHDRIDCAAAAAALAESLAAPDWAGPLVWTHGDFIPPNLLATNGRLSAVIDFGSAGLAEPARDLVPAWAVLTAETRPLLRAALDVDQATWLRGRGWALSQALLIVPYYWESNPPLVRVALRVIDEVLADFGR